MKHMLWKGHSKSKHDEASSAMAISSSIFRTRRNSDGSLPGLMPVCLSSGSMPPPLPAAAAAAVIAEETTITSASARSHDNDVFPLVVNKQATRRKTTRSTTTTTTTAAAATTSTTHSSTSRLRVRFPFIQKSNNVLLLQLTVAAMFLSWMFATPRLFIWYASYLIVRQIQHYAVKWMNYYRQDLRPLARTLQAAYNRFQQETRKTVSGSYSRQLAAAYMLTMCTAPGESYVAKVIRYKMSMLNLDFMDELEQRWQGVKTRLTTAANTTTGSVQQEA